MKNLLLIIFAFCGFCLLFSCEKADTPTIVSVTPDAAPADSLVIFEGMNLADIETITFSGQIVNFNTAYNSDVALLYRVGTGIPLGDHEVVITTPGGSATTNFRVTLNPPSIFSVLPESAAPGEIVTIKGKNFFDPVEVFFFDGIKAETIVVTPDSMRVIVPEGIQKGKVTVVANGGEAESPVDFFITTSVLVNDFDGNGIRSETDKWIFVGAVDQNAMNAIHDSNPEPIDGNFLKISGDDELGIQWIGGVENHAWDVDDFENFGIRSSINNTLLEMDVNTNGSENTNVIFIFRERDGSANDFTHEIKIDGEGWQQISIPLGRFTDLNGITVDPAKIMTLKIHLIDSDDSGEQLELNVDNIIFQELL